MKSKICNICHLGIDETKEFVRNTHFKNSKAILSEGFYHLNCFREKVLGVGQLKKIQNQATKLMQFAKEKMGMEEVVDIE